MLTNEEKDALYQLILATIGEDPSLRQSRYDFNEETVAVVEEMLTANAKCNHSVKELLVGLLGGASLLTRGWLRRWLKTAGKALKQEAVKLRGYACLVTTKAQWRNAIISTVY